MGAGRGHVKPIGPASAVKIIYPEDVVLRVRRSTGCRRRSPSKRELTRCSICC
jgi:hypothetical protein